MQPAEFFSHAMEWLAPGSAVDALGTRNPMGIELNQMISGGSSGGPDLLVVRVVLAVGIGSTN